MDVGKFCRSAVGQVINMVMPPACLNCAQPVQSAGDLCMDCWSGIQFLSPPWCACCGLPFAYDEGAQSICGACSEKQPAFDRARAVYVYSEQSRDMILKFKHGDRTDMAPAFAHWLARAGQDLLQTAEILAPVPLHRRRILKRRYNQAALIAAHLPRPPGCRYIPDLLHRVKNTGSQGGLNRRARYRNLSGAFKINEKFKADIAGKRVLLIDDVLTTGATVETCAAQIKRAGAHSVDVLTLARIVRDEI